MRRAAMASLTMPQDRCRIVQSTLVEVMAAIRRR
jgi:hypothetical protein